MKRGLSFVILLLLLGLIAAPTILIDNPVYARDEIFRVAIGLFDINSKEDRNDQILTFSTTNNVTKARILNMTELDMADGQDGMIERITFSFPNVTVNVGDEFRACIILFDNLEHICKGGYDSPINTVEYVGLSLDDAEPD